MGFITRRVADTAVLLDAVVNGVSYTEAARHPPGRLRIALSLKPPVPARVDPEVRNSVRGVGDALRGLGHQVTERDPDWGRAADATTVLYLGGIARDATRFEHPERFQRRTRGFVRLGRASGGLVERARRAQAEHAARISGLFEDFEVLLTPTCARPPVSAAHWEGMSATRTLVGMAATFPFTPVWNMTGQPAVSVPGPPSSDGLPIGAQLIGPPDAEQRLLSLVAQLEAELDWAAPRPPLS